MRAHFSLGASKFIELPRATTPATVHQRFRAGASDARFKSRARYERGLERAARQEPAAALGRVQGRLLPRRGAPTEGLRRRAGVDLGVDVTVVQTPLSVFCAKNHE